MASENHATSDKKLALSRSLMYFNNVKLRNSKSSFELSLILLIPQAFLPKELVAMQHQPLDVTSFSPISILTSFIHSL